VAEEDITARGKGCRERNGRSVTSAQVMRGAVWMTRRNLHGLGKDEPLWL
jgi:hypothetical protein